MVNFVRISALLWADILVAYALFVMQNYLTDVWKLNFTHAAAILNFWNGLSMILPVSFLFLVDAFLGNFGMLVISSIAYSVGIGFVTMSTPPVLAKSTGMCKRYEPECIGYTQKVLFYTGMPLIAVGLAGNLVSVQAFLADQKPKTKEENNNQSNKGDLKEICQIPGLILVVLLPIIGAIALPYIKPWTLRFGIPAIFTAFATFLFFTGAREYVKPPLKERSPLTNVYRVLVASFFKKSLPFPDDNKQLYRRTNEGDKRFTRTRFLRCLEKAAIIPGDKSQQDLVNPGWRLCSVAEVEEAKIAIRMVPMWLTFIICGIVSSIGNTYFVEQANHLNRHWGKWNLPLAALLLFFKWARTSFDAVASCMLKPPKKYAPPAGIVVSMLFSILCCITAAKTEERRLNAVRKHGLLDKPDEDIPMSVYWLLFQFCLLAGLDSFREKSVGAFYDVQAPPSMKDYLKYLTDGVTGLGFMFSVLSVYVVGKVSEKGSKPNWFQDTLNKSRLDRYYWVLAVMSAVNLAVFFVVALCYRYQDCKAEDEEVADEAGGGADPGTGGDEGEDQSCSCCCC